MIARLQPIPFPGVDSVESLSRRGSSSWSLSKFLEHSPLPMWIFDPGTLRFLAVNQAAVRQYGWSREEFLEMTLDEVRPVNAASPISAILQEARIGTAGVKSAPDLQHITKEGRVLRVEVAWNAIEYE